MEIKVGQLTVKTVEDKVEVTAPYSTANNNRYRGRGGSWTGSAWSFKDIANVWVLITELFGVVKGENKVVTALVKPEGDRVDLLTVGGYVLAQRRDRDRAVDLKEGVEIISGEFSDYGGSRKNPMVTWSGELELSLVCTFKFAEEHDLEVIEEKEVNPLAVYTDEELKQELERRAVA